MPPKKCFRGPNLQGAARILTEVYGSVPTCPTVVRTFVPKDPPQLQAEATPAPPQVAPGRALSIDETFLEQLFLQEVPC